MKRLLILLTLITFTFPVLSNNFDLKEFMHEVYTNYQYKTDDEQFGSPEYWQTPEEFEKNKAGDCEDFAIYVRDKVKKQKGYKVYTYSIIYIDNNNEQSGHCINIIEDKLNKKRYITDNYLLHEVKNKSSHIQTIEDWMSSRVFKLEEIFKVRSRIFYGHQSVFHYLYNNSSVKRYR